MKIPRMSWISDGELVAHKPKRPRVGAVIVFKEDVDPARAQELIDMMTVRLIEKTEVVEYDAARGSPVWYIP